MESYQQLEQQFGEVIGNPNTVAVSSGTAALHLALEVLKKKGWNDAANIIVPDFTMVACARAITMSKLIPAFVDCTDDLLMTLKNPPTWNVRGIMAVHIYGRVCNMTQIVEFAKENQIVIVEDLAEAHGILPHPETDAACWSFYQNKIVHGQEGGMIAFKKPEDAEKARLLRSLGFTAEHDFKHLARGHNYRLANALAELIIPSLQCMSLNLEKRKQVEAWYDKLIPSAWKMPERQSVWVYDIRLPDMNIDFIVKALNEKGIAARHGFKPMTTQEEYLYYDAGFTKSNLNALRLSKEIMYLPVKPEMTLADVCQITSSLFVAIEQQSKQRTS